MPWPQLRAVNLLSTQSIASKPGPKGACPLAVDMKFSQPSECNSLSPSTLPSPSPFKLAGSENDFKNQYSLLKGTFRKVEDFPIFAIIPNGPKSLLVFWHNIQWLSCKYEEDSS